MKQYITVADLEKFSNKEQLEIATLFGQYGNCCNTGGESMNLGKLSERITIGKMIEILESKFPTIYIENQLPAGLRDKIRYRVFQQGAGQHYGDNLCDALWNAVKDVL